jgi:hypothetical protein
MKFGEIFTEYLHGDQEWFLEKCSHVEYKRLKKVLKSCRSCKAFGDSWNSECQCESCPRKVFFCLIFFFFFGGGGGVIGTDYSLSSRY